MSELEIRRLAGIAGKPPVRSQDLAEWNDAVNSSVEIEGYSLYGGKDNDRTLDALCGIPFVITAISYRRGNIIPAGETDSRDYISAEALIHPMHATEFARKRIVFNDGSTGIYRQLTRILSQRGLLDVPADLPEEGEANATRYDSSFTTDDNESVRISLAEGIYCPEGLRRSEYRNKDGRQAFTWYLA